MAATAHRRRRGVEQKKGWKGRDPVCVERNQLGGPGLTC